MTAKEFAYKYLKKIRPTIFDSEPGVRLPEAYKKFYNEWRNTPAKPVNYIPYTGKTWVRNETTGEIKRVEDIPIRGKMPPELNWVLTGGEMVIQGFTKKTGSQKLRRTNRVPRFWVPSLYRSVVYSEILDKYLAANITKRVIELIHEHEGFDNYLLQNKACDLKNLVALKLKQKILLALSNKDLPYDEAKNDEIYQKYKQYLIPKEEIEWYGLNITEAFRKLKEMDEAEKKAGIKPLKHVFRAQLIQKLEDEKHGKDQTGKQSVQWLT